MTKTCALLAVLAGLAGCGDNHRDHDGEPDELNQPPVTATSLSGTVPEDGTIPIDASATDPEGDPVTYAATAPGHGTISGTGPSFSYTPAANFSGEDRFTITVSDGTHSVDVPVSITVTEVNDAPVASDLQAATNENQGVAVALEASDLDGPALSYEIVDAPAHGTLTGVAPNLAYTPATRYFGADSFTYRVSDGTLASNLATVTIAVADQITCGDGVVEGGEQCDDGNADDTDACLQSCMAASCGDGLVHAGTEACDDGNGDNTDACLTTCAVASCGDGSVRAETEACDDGNQSNTDACLNSCVTASCGDGLIQAGIEACDDGNQSNTDACLTTCQAAACRDGFVQDGVETCDDGNQSNTDACPMTCEPARCGDGFVADGSEDCDDGNTGDNDGCGHSCKVEQCGDGLVQFPLGETCDDGNLTDRDGCDASCQVEPFVTVAPVKLSGALSCTTAVANAARKIAVDVSGTIYTVMMCGSAAYATVSTTRGVSFAEPIDVSAALPGAPITVSQVAVASGPTGVAYVAMMLNSGAVYLRTTEDRGATWGAAVLVGTSTSTSSGLSLQSFNDDLYIGFSVSGGVAVARNHNRGTGTFDLTPVSMSIAYFDLLYDVRLGTLAVCADTPTFHIRASSDAGVTFAAELNPPGSEYYSDWAIGNGNIYVSGTNLGSSGNASLLYVIPTDDLTTSRSVAGLPVVWVAQTRSIAADAAGNAFVASQLNSGGVQLDRLPYGATAFDAPRTISATGGSPVAAPLPGGQGAAVVYTDGTSVWATVQAY